MSSEDLPVILVAAKDSSAASKIISELIEKDVSNDTEVDYMWEISNKYYTVQVRLRALVDGESTPNVDRVEAHVIYLAEDECTCECVERRATRARAAAARGVGMGEGEVQLVLADCSTAALPKALQAAALRLHFELIPLRDVSASPPPQQPPSAPAGPFPELRGAARAREALHAHTWPRMHLAPHVSPFAGWASNGAHDGSGSGSSSADGDSDLELELEPELEPDEAACVRRAELFADALCAIDGVRGRGGALAGEGRDEQRLLRAEQLVAAFCRALGTHLDRL